jgi:hypothetical protein
LRSTILLVSLAIFYLVLDYYLTLSSPYAVCSRHGENVYTVDKHNRQSQCFVVHNAHIIDVGSLGRINRSYIFHT